MAEAREVIEKHRSGGSTAKVDGLEIFYRKGGEGGVPMVMTHGIPRSSFLYRNMLPILSEKRTVRAWDLYGFGLSDKPKDKARYYFPEFERVLGLFIDEMGFDKVHLVCHDVGGPFSIGWAVHNPHRIASLTILNTTVFLSGFIIPGPVLSMILTPYSWQEMRMTDSAFADMIHSYIQEKALFHPEALSGAEAAAYKELLTREGGRWTLARTLKAYRVIMPYLRGIVRGLPGFSRPTLILWGKHDPFCTLPISSKFMLKLPNSELRVIPDASHFLQEDAPEEASRIILDFIQRAENKS